MLNRLTALTAMGILIGLPLALPAAAQTPEVNFGGGGIGTLLCGSRPDRPQITVEPGGTVWLTNGLGSTAQLKIDDVATATVASGETAEVRFDRGPVQVLMVPECPLNLNTKYKALTVHVALPAPSATASAGPGGVLIVARPPGARDAALPRSQPAPTTSVLEGPGASVVDAGGTTKNPAEPPPDKRPIGLLAIIAAVCVAGLLAGVVRVIITQRATRLA
jgi:hypothetical protein